jgi:hypothetical protein
VTRLATNSTRRKGSVCCAIYTRKSSEEGLEQEFNSLQAQREACESFITSQRHEGWVCLPKTYDDGGFSGATKGMRRLRAAGFFAAAVRLWIPGSDAAPDAALLVGQQGQMHATAQRRDHAPRGDGAFWD